jgi:uncharacterized protein (DUF2236 family)
MLRRVHEEHLVGLMYGQRALCIGALAPLNYVGTSEHSYAKLTPFKRLAHTGKAFEQIFFGTKSQAGKVLSYVNRLHDQVNGTLPEGAGPFPAGTPVMADSAQCFYELLVRELSDGERDELWEDYLRFAELFGMPREQAPRSWEEFRTYYRERLASDEMFLTDEARYVGYATAFEIPMPAVQQPGKRVHDLLMLGSLPRRVRELYRLEYTRRQQLVFEATVGAVRAARRLTPGPIARGPNTRSFDGVARTERWRIEHGRPTPQLRDDSAPEAREPARPARQAV